MYIDILRRVRDAVRRKRPEKWRTNSWCLLHNNAPAYRSLFVKDFLAKNSVTTLELPPYSPDMTPANFYPFPRLITDLKERRFCDSTNIIKNATEKLKRPPQNGFQECFQ
jgi:transposase